MRSRSQFLSHLLAVAGLSVSLAAAPARADEAVLLSSTAPGYVPGMIVAANERLTVPEGANATLLFRSGEMLRLRGPFDGPLRSFETRNGGTMSIASLAESLRLQGIDAAVVGGTRAIPRLGGPRRPPATDILVDPQRSATYCIDPADSVWIARPEEPVDRIRLRRHGVTREIAWPAGAVRVEWPADVPVEDGDRFEVLDGSGNAGATATFRMVDGKASTEAARLAGAVLMGCQDQVQPALRDLARAVSPTELWLSTDRGRQPTYRPGEAVRLAIQSNGDGFLYCVYRSADETVVPVFPAGALDGARLRGHEALELPGRRRGDVLLAGPRGDGLIACYLADRDIGPELPHALLGDRTVRLPENLASHIDAIFDGISGTRIVKASIPVRVE